MLSKRDAALRAEATKEILGAAARLEGSVGQSAFILTIYNHPRAALRAIERQEARLRRAKAALRKWAKRGKR